MTVDARIKALLDNGGTALTAVFILDQNYDEAAMPYASFLDPLSEVPSLSGDARTLAWLRDLQVDVWQNRDDYDEELPLAVVNILDGAHVDGGVGLRVTQTLRLPDDDKTIVHHAITVSVHRLR